MSSIAQRVATLRTTVEERVRSAVGSKTVSALIDFPNYPNVGDSAIYLGQLACLKSLGIPRPRFICDFRTYDRRALAGAVGNGVILLTGGGSFGDLWSPAQECREGILGAFPDNPVIQLPQTLHFELPENLERARRAVNEHRNVTLLWRDERSFEIAQREFTGKSELCPDMAFCLGPLDTPRAPTKSIVWLLRSDKESAVTFPADAELHAIDWLDEHDTMLRRVNYTLMGATCRDPSNSSSRKLLMQTYAPLARQRLRRGLRMLSAARVVVTDRLHGHILSMLLGKPHVILDNSYGKLSSFHEKWTTGVDGVDFARTPEEALEFATRLAQRSGIAEPHYAGR